MIPIRFSSELERSVRDMAQECVFHILDNCDPGRLAMGGFEFDGFDRATHVLGFGKASVGMSLACAKRLGPLCAGGVVLAPAGLVPEAGSEGGIRYIGVDHPVPTARNVEATGVLTKYAQSIPDTENCIVCISGGGSAHLCSPKQGVSLSEIVETTTVLNAQGASIHRLNDARRKLEELKAGGLAEVLGHVHRCEAMVLSDVLGNDPEVIASGPMMNQDFPVRHTIIGDHQAALASAAGFLVSRNHPFHHCEAMISGDARVQGERLADVYMNESRRVAWGCVAAGETTVDTQDADGVGGPCLEFALCCALRLAGNGCVDWVVLCLATDGIDGPSEAAGAVITSGMLLGTEKQVAAQKAIETHDTLRFLDAIGATIRTGATGTNLNDVYMVWSFEAFEAD